MTFCPHCGREIFDNSVFCKYCGQKVIAEEVAEEYVVVDEPASERATETPAEPQKNDLVFSIVGLALAVVVPLAGLIMSIIGKKKAKANADGQPFTGKNKVANILSTIGIPVSIANMVIRFLAILWVVAWCVIAVLIATRSGVGNAVMHAARFVGGVLF